MLHTVQYVRINPVFMLLIAREMYNIAVM